MNADKILKSLAELQQNLQDIESAKQQVLNVVNSSAEFSSSASACKIAFEGIASSSREIVENFNSLSVNLLSQLSNNIVLLQNEILRLNEFKQNFVSISNNLDNLLNKVDTQYSDISNRLNLLDSNLQLIKEDVSKKKCLIDLLPAKFPSLPAITRRERK